MREHNKRWLLGVMKTSGSKRTHLRNWRYADNRHSKRDEPFDDLSTHESIQSTKKFYNGKINYGLLVRVLRGQIGEDWDSVYSEYVNRIPSKLMDDKEMIYCFVADKVEFIEGKPWNKRTQLFIWTGEEFEPPHWTEVKSTPELREFYVDPLTNRLIHIQ
jgi:hypothetical protein